MCAAKAGVRPQHPDWSVGRVFDRQIGLIRGGTRPTAPVHDGKCGANALHATIIGNWEEPSGESRFKQGETDMGDKGKKDKGKREQQKKAQLNLKEKRKQKKEKKK